MKKQEIPTPREAATLMSEITRHLNFIVAATVLAPEDIGLVMSGIKDSLKDLIAIRQHDELESVIKDITNMLVEASKSIRLEEGDE